MNIAYMMFKAQYVLDEISAINDEIKSTHQDVFGPLNNAGYDATRDMTLAEALCYPHTKHRPTRFDQMAATTVWDLLRANNSTEDQFKRVSCTSGTFVFNCHHVRAVFGRHPFVQMLLAGGFEEELENPTISPTMLERISLMAPNPTSALAVKNLWVTRGFQQHRRFRGLQPHTSVVRRFFSVVLHQSNIQAPEASFITNQIADELDMDPIDVNAAMVVIGRDIKKK